jgi:hypothetical protein
MRKRLTLGSGLGVLKVHALGSGLGVQKVHALGSGLGVLIGSTLG